MGPAALIVVMLALALGGWWATSASPFEEGGLHAVAPLGVGESMGYAVILHPGLDADRSSLEGVVLRSLQIVGEGIDDGSIEVQELGLCPRTGQGLAYTQTICGTPHEVAGVTLDASTLHERGHTTVAAVLVARKPGIHRIDGLRVRVRDGWRFGAQLIGDRVCFAVGREPNEADLDDC